MSDIVKSEEQHQLPPTWGISERGLRAIKTAVAMSNTKHGLFASIPIVCKSAQCPYADSCYLLTMNLDTPGERCPQEIAAIMERFEAYTNQLDISVDNMVDLNLIKNLVDIEIQIVRADNKVAMNGDFIENVIAAISPQGDAYYKPELSKAAEFKLKLLAEHSKILSLLHATRKDKAADKTTIVMDASSYAASLLKKARDMEAEVIDVE